MDVAMESDIAVGLKLGEPTMWLGKMSGPRRFVNEQPVLEALSPSGLRAAFADVRIL